MLRLTRLAARGKSLALHRGRRWAGRARRAEGEYRPYSTDEQPGSAGFSVGRIQRSFCHTLLGCWVVCLLAIASGARVGAQSESLTLLFPDGRHTISTTTARGRDMVALDDLARLFDLEVLGELTPGRISVAYRGQTIILTDGDRIVSVAGQLVSLRVAPVRIGGIWKVPLGFLNQALAQVYDEAIAVRPRSRLVLVGDVTVPTITATYRGRRQSGRLSLVVAPDTPFTIDEEQGALIVQFNASGLDLRPLPSPDGNFVSRFAAGASSPAFRVEVGPSFDSFEVATRSDGDDQVEIVVTLRAAETPPAAALDAAPARAAVNPGSSAALAPEFDRLPDLTATPTLRVVAIDAGHGGANIGTQGENAVEKDITLSVTRRLRDAIQRQLGLRVVLTRSRDNEVKLDQRAAIANNNKADLFISLHVNSSVQPTVSGAEVYYLGAEEYGTKASGPAGSGLRESGTEESGAEEEAGAERASRAVPVVGGGTRTLDLVEWDTAQTRYLDRSAQLAAIIHRALSRRIPMSSRGVQEAPFRVLVGANMPAVLIEMGYISNPEDHSRLTSGAFQNAVVGAIIDGILRFRDTLGRPGPPSGG